MAKRQQKFFQSATSIAQATRWRKRKEFLHEPVEFSHEPVNRALTRRRRDRSPRRAFHQPTKHRKVHNTDNALLASFSPWQSIMDKTGASLSCLYSTIQVWCWWFGFNCCGGRDYWRQNLENPAMSLICKFTTKRCYYSNVGVSSRNSVWTNQCRVILQGRGHRFGMKWQLSFQKSEIQPNFDASRTRPFQKRRQWGQRRLLFLICGLSNLFYNCYTQRHVIFWWIRVLEASKRSKSPSLPCYNWQICNANAKNGSTDPLITRKLVSWSFSVILLSVLSV